MTGELREDELLLTRRVALASLMAAALVGIGCDKRKHGPESPTADLAKEFHPIGKRLREAVPDRHRRQAVHALLDEIKQQLVGLNTIVGDWRRELVVLRAAEAERHELLVEITTKHNRRVLDSLEEAAKHAMSLRRYLTREEWSQVFPPTTRADP